MSRDTAERRNNPEETVPNKSELGFRLTRRISHCFRPKPIPRNYHRLSDHQTVPVFYDDQNGIPSPVVTDASAGRNEQQNDERRNNFCLPPKCSDPIVFIRAHRTLSSANGHLEGCFGYPRSGKFPDVNPTQSEDDGLTA
jgi:hypothetical protein